MLTKTIVRVYDFISQKYEKPRYANLTPEDAIGLHGIKCEFLVLKGISLSTACHYILLQLGYFPPFVHILWRLSPHESFKSTIQYEFIGMKNPITLCQINELFSMNQTQKGGSNANEEEENEDSSSSFLEKVLFDTPEDDYTSLISSLFGKEDEEKEKNDVIFISDLSINISMDFLRLFRSNKVKFFDVTKSYIVKDYLELKIFPVKDLLKIFKDAEDPSFLRDAVLYPYWPSAFEFLNNNFEINHQMVKSFQRDFKEKNDFFHELSRKLSKSSLKPRIQVTLLNLKIYDKPGFYFQIQEIYNNLIFSEEMFAAQIFLEVRENIICLSDGLNISSVPKVPNEPFSEPTLLIFFDILFVRITLTIKAYGQISMNFNWHRSTYLSLSVYKDVVYDTIRKITTLLKNVNCPFLMGILTRFVEEKDDFNGEISVTGDISNEISNYNSKLLSQKMTKMTDNNILSDGSLEVEKKMQLKVRLNIVPTNIKRIKFFLTQYHIQNEFAFQLQLEGSKDQKRVWNQSFVGIRITVSVHGTLLIFKLDSLPIISSEAIPLIAQFVANFYQDCYNSEAQIAAKNSNSQKLYALYFVDSRRFERRYSSACQYGKQPFVIDDIDSLSEEEILRTIKVPSLTTGKDFTLLCPKSYPKPNFIINEKGWAAVCCNKEAPTPGSFRAALQEWLSIHHHITEEEYQKLHVKFGSKKNKPQHIMNFYKVFYPNRLYHLPDSWLEFFEKREKKRPYVMGLVNDKTCTHTMITILLDKINTPLNDLLAFIMEMKQIPTTWSSQNYNLIYEKEDLLNFFAGHGLEMTIDNECILKILGDFLMTKKIIMQIFRFDGPRIDFEPSENLHTIRHLSTIDDWNIMIIVVRDRTNFGVLIWTNLSQKNNDSIITYGTNKMNQEILIPAIEEKILEERNLSPTGLDNLNFCIDGIIYQPDFNLSGSVVIWQGKKILVPCNLHGFDFRFPILDLKELFINLPEITLILEFIKLLEDEFKISIGIHHIDKSLIYPNRALLMTTEGPWPIDISDNQTELKISTMGIIDIYPGTFEFIVYQATEISTTKFNFLHNCHNALIFLIREIIKKSAFSPMRQKLEKISCTEGGETYWRTIIKEMKNPIDQMIMTKLPHDSFDQDTLKNQIFLFDLDEFHQALEDMNEFKNYFQDNIIFITEDDLDFGLFTLASSEKLLSLRPLPVVEEHLESLFDYFNEKIDSTGYIEEIFYPKLIRINYVPALNIRKNSHFQQQSICVQMRENIF